MRHPPLLAVRSSTTRNSSWAVRPIASIDSSALDASSGRFAMSRLPTPAWTVMTARVWATTSWSSWAMRTRSSRTCLRVRSASAICSLCGLLAETVFVSPPGGHRITHEPSGPQRHEALDGQQCNRRGWCPQCGVDQRSTDRHRRSHGGGNRDPSGHLRGDQVRGQRKEHGERKRGSPQSDDHGDRGDRCGQHRQWPSAQEEYGTTGQQGEGEPRSPLVGMRPQGQDDRGQSNHGGKGDDHRHRRSLKVPVIRSRGPSVGGSLDTATTVQNASAQRIRLQDDACRWPNKAAG